MTFLQYIHKQNLKIDEEYPPFDLGKKFEVHVEWLQQKTDIGNKNLYVFLCDKLKGDIYEWAKFLRMDLPSGETPMLVKLQEGYIYAKLNQRKSDDIFVYQPEMPTKNDFTGWFLWFLWFL